MSCLKHSSVVYISTSLELRTVIDCLFTIQWTGTLNQIVILISPAPVGYLYLDKTSFGGHSLHPLGL